MWMVVQVLNEKICNFIYCIGPCWIVDVPAGDWTNFSKTLIATHSVEEIITLQVALLSIVISPQRGTDSSLPQNSFFTLIIHPESHACQPLVSFPLMSVLHLCEWEDLILLFSYFYWDSWTSGHTSIFTADSPQEIPDFIDHLDEIKLINPV